MSKPFRKLVLGLETGLDGGSISLFEQGREVDFAYGSGNISKSEDILLLLDSLLEKNSIRKTEIGTIRVSDGPGSLTGIRIGLSIARGMGSALSAHVRKISVLDALVSNAGADREKVRAAFYTARNGIYSREYRIESETFRSVGETVRARDAAAFAAHLKNSENNKALVVNEEFLKHFADGFEFREFLAQRRFQTVNGCAASILARAEESTLRPIMKDD